MIPQNTTGRFTGRAVFASLALAAAAMVYVVGAASASAAPLFGLYNTGVDPGVTGSLDNHYKVTLEGSSTAPTQAYVADLTALPYSPGDSATSKFVAPQASYANHQVDAGGEYDFSTTFDLTAVNMSLVSIQGRFESDDRIDQILLNGHPLLSSPLADPGYKAFSSYINLVPNSAFLLPTTNTLTFNVFNYTNQDTDPVALRAEYLLAVPEPSTWAMFGVMGSLLLGGAWLRRRRIAAV